MDWRTCAILRHVRQLSAEHGADNFSDQELLERYAVDRDEAAFAALVRRHGPMVWRTCLTILKHEHDAEDAFQAAFLVLARRVSSIRKRASIASWLYAVAYHVALRARAGVSRRTVPEDGGEAISEADPQAEAAQREQIGILHEELSRLAEKYRAPLVLCYLEGKTQDEAAQQLAWSKRTFERRLGQARGLLQLRLHRRGFALSAVFAASAIAHPAQSAALSARLVLTTVHALATRSAALGGAPTKAVALAESVLRTAALAKLKTLAILAIVCGILVGGTGVLAHQALVGLNADAAQVNRPSPPQARLTPEPAPRKKDRHDLFGDPLPDGVQARLGTVRLRVGHAVYAVAFAPDGKTLAAGGGNNVRIWDTATGTTVHHLEAPASRVLPIAFAPDGKTLAAGGLGNAIRLWDLETGNALREFWGQEEAVFGLAFSPDGRTLASGGADRIVRLWQVATGKETGCLKVPTPEGTHPLTWPIAVLPDNRTIVTRDMNQRLRLWDADTGAELHQLDLLPQHPSAVAVAHGGAILATAERDPLVIRFWQTASGQELRQLNVPQVRADALAFSAKVKVLAAGYADGMIRLWEVATGAERGQIRTDQIGFTGLTFSPDGRLLASWHDCSVRLWKVTTGEELHPVEGHRDGIMAVAFRSGKQRLASVGARGTIRLWDPDTGRQFGSRGTAQREDEEMAVAFSPDGRLLASGSMSGIIRVSDAETGQEFRRWQGHKGLIYALAFAPDGQTLVSGGADKAVALWEPLAGRERYRIVDNPDVVQSVAFAPNGRLLAAGCMDGSLRLWDAATGKAWYRVPAVSHRIRSLTFSPDGKTLAAATGVAVAGQGSVAVWLWEVATGQVRWHATAPDAGGAFALVFAPDGRILALAGGDHQIHRWDLAARRELPPLTGHMGEVRCLAFSPDGTVLASGSMDTTALIWPQTPLPAHPASRKGPLSPQELETLWTDLASADAGKADRAIWNLTGTAGQSVPFLDARLRLATVEVGPPSKEGLPLDPQTAVPLPPQLRMLRAVEVLERIGTPEAYRLLQTLATDAAETQVAAEARAALGRLDKRRTATP
jgi:RNA polymerase sigma factor (sigma-70 family)